MGIEEVAKEINELLEWAESHNYEVDPDAFNDAASDCYMHARKAAGQRGVVGYRAGKLDGMSKGVDSLVKAMLMISMSITFEHVDHFRRLERKD